MRFTMLHKLISYLMIGTSVLSVVISPEIPAAVGALVALALVASWFVEPSRFNLERFIAPWNIATVLFFFYLIVDVIRGSSIIVAGAYFLLFVLTNKLFNRHTSKDYMQAYVISFLLLVVATTLNTDLSFAICFSLYALLAIWTLSLFHLQREMVENYLLKHSDTTQSEKVEVQRILNSRRIVGRSFLLGTLSIWIAVLFGAGAIFLLFPRIGFGLFISQKRGGVALAGFRERVELGHHGVIRHNPNVVMRIIFPTGRPKQQLRFRGSAFDHYDNGTWSHSAPLRGLTQPLAAQEHLYVVNPAPGLPADLLPSQLRRRLLRQDIYLEPLDTTILFAADRPVAIEQHRSSIFRTYGLVPRRGPLGEIRLQGAHSAGIQYTAYSHLPVPSPVILRQGHALRDPRWAHYLQLPSDFPPRIRELATRITAGQPTLYDQVLAVQRYLHTHYAYTLQLSHDPHLEPVDEFLFQTRRGHCEYFASAMALLLRSVGIHTRSVNGFAGGEWNRYGEYLALRQGDAHAWVEVLFDNVGWVTFDPTPTGETMAPEHESMGAGLRQVLDTLRMRWFRYVVEYDLKQQISLLKQLQEVMRSASGSQGWLKEHARAIAIVTAVILLGLGGLFWFRRRRRWPGSRTTQPAAREGPATRLYQRMLDLLARAGHAKPPSATPQEFSAHLRQQGFAPNKLVERITHCYYEVRYGGQVWSAEVEQELQVLLKELAREVSP